MRLNLCVLFAVLLGTAAGHAQVWTVANLHPVGALNSSLAGGAGGQQVGNVTFGDASTSGAQHASQGELR